MHNDNKKTDQDRYLHALFVLSRAPYPIEQNLNATAREYMHLKMAISIIGALTQMLVG